MAVGDDQRLSLNHKIAINREPMRYKLRERGRQRSVEAARSFAIAFVIYTLAVNMRLKLKDKRPLESPLGTRDTFPFFFFTTVSFEATLSLFFYIDFQLNSFQQIFIARYLSTLTAVRSSTTR